MLIKPDAILGPELFNLSFTSLHHLFWHCFALKGRLCLGQGLVGDLCPGLHSEMSLMEEIEGGGT